MANVGDERLVGGRGLTVEQVAQMTKPELQEELRKRHLRLGGIKRDLVARLLAALRLEQEHGARDDDPEDDDNDDVEDDDNGEIDVTGNYLDVNVLENRDHNNQDGGVQVTPVIRQDEPLLRFEDVKDSLEKFSGDDLLSINRWIKDFEEMAKMCGWTDIHMVVFAKKLLTGSAQAFVRQARCRSWHKSWAMLKEALQDEFKNVVSDQQVHRELAQRKKKADESLLQYMYNMSEIAEQGEVAEQSLIDYIIQGIPDEVTNETTLYEAKSMPELKERFKQYEAMKRDMKMEMRAIFEGQKSHVSAEYPNKSKCRQCDDLSVSLKEIRSALQQVELKHVKNVKIGNFELRALIDTGSELSLMRADQYVKIGAPSLSHKIIEFRDIGPEKSRTLGGFSTDVLIDGESYAITIHVVSDTAMQHSLVIGTDFLNTVELIVKKGNISIRKVEEKDCIIRKC